MQSQCCVVVLCQSRHKHGIPRISESGKASHVNIHLPADVDVLNFAWGQFPVSEVFTNVWFEPSSGPTSLLEGPL